MPPEAPAAFPETRWSLVLRARGADEEGRVAGALDELCRQYWFPLYAFARRAGHAAPEAEDLTQGFFALLLSRQLLEKADRERGRLRSFLLGTFKNFMSTEARRDRRLRRGGGQVVFSLDQAQAEDWFGREPSAASPPEERFDRDWASATVTHAFQALEADCHRRGKGVLFARLREFLSWDRAEPEFATAARELGLSIGATRVAVHRLRLAFRRELEAQVAQTVTTREELDAEIAHLIQLIVSE